MGVPQEQGAVPHPVVDVLAAVHVPLAGPGGPLDVERERRQVPAVVRDAAGDHPPSALPARPRARQGLPIPLAHRLPHHAVSSSRAAATGPRRAFRCPTSLPSVSSNAWCSPSGRLSTRGPGGARQSVDAPRANHRAGQPRLLLRGVEQGAAGGQGEVRHHAPGPPVRGAGDDQVVRPDHRGDLRAVRDVAHDPRPDPPHADLVAAVTDPDRDRARPPPEEERVERRVHRRHRPPPGIVVAAVDGPPGSLDRDEMRRAERADRARAPSGAPPPARPARAIRSRGSPSARRHASRRGATGGSAR